MASSTTGEYVVSPNAPHTHTVILLHGRDSEAEEFASEFFESQGTDDRTLAQMFPTIKWVFPRSKTRQSARFETALCQWFDIWPIEEPQQQKDIQTAGLKESVSSILEAVLREASLVAPEKILLGGISQGSATAIHALLGCDAPLAGFIGLCTWLPFQAEVADSTHDRASIGMFDQHCFARTEALSRVALMLRDPC